MDPEADHVNISIWPGVSRIMKLVVGYPSGKWGRG